MGPVYISFQMLLYYPSLLLLFYIYAVFVIPLRSRVFRRDYWFSIKNSLERSDIGHLLKRRDIGDFLKRTDIGHIIMGAIKRWKRGGKYK